jgi:hypothetical protein
MFQPSGNYPTADVTQETVTITPSIVNASAVAFTFTNANLKNTNVGYRITGADANDFTDATIVGQVSLDANGNATLTKTIISTEDLGDDKTFFVSAFGINNKITGSSSNVSIQTNYPMIATGGNSFIDSGYVYHVFTATGNLTVTQAQSGPVYNGIRALVVAAGGSVATSGSIRSGAGAGGLRDANVYLTTGTYTATVGPTTSVGTTVGNNGAGSSFANISTTGGGGGISGQFVNGRNGGSGSGAGGSASAIPGNGISGQGFRGGYGIDLGWPGGGGGAGGFGGTAGSNPFSYGGSGGSGRYIPWAPVAFGDPNNINFFAGGGSGLNPLTLYSAGNRGPGGGGNVNARNTGLAGIVIVAYPDFEAFRSLTTV